MKISPSATLEESLVRLAKRNLTNVQLRVLLFIYHKESDSRSTYSWYVRAASNELGIPESTAKWCLSNLRDMLLIKAGTLAEKGVPLRMTYPGRLVAESALQFCAEGKKARKADEKEPLIIAVSSSGNDSR